MNSRERENILQDLQSGDEEVRWLAVERLTELPAAEAIPRLVEQLGDPSWRVRKAAIERLSETRELALSVDALVSALGDGENPGRRNAALEALTRCGDEAVPALIEASRSPDVDVRKQVVDALAGIGNPEAAERLMQLLEDDDANVRGAAADALGSVAGMPVVAALLRSVQEDAEPLVRLSALRALGRLEAAVPVQALEGALGDPLLRPAGYALLGLSDESQAVELLLKGLSASARSAREAAIEAVVRLAVRSEPEASERLAQRLRGLRPELGELVSDGAERLSEANLSRRMALVQFFGLLQSSDTVLPLLEAGRDEALTEIALSALESFAGQADAEVAASWDRISPDARTLACALLGRTRGQGGEETLRGLLASEDPELRAAAARALGRRCCAPALPELVAGLVSASADEEAEEEADAFTEAIVAVAAANDVDSAAGHCVSLLEEHMDRASERFRLAAARILGRIAARETLPRLELMISDPSPAVRRAAVEALALVAPDAFEPLRLGLADEAPQVRIGAVAALAASEDPAVIGDLAQVLADPQERVCAAAARALGGWIRQHGGARPEALATALEALCSVLPQGGPAAMAAVEALQALGGADAASRVRPLLEADDPELVQSAIACIGRHGGPDELQDLMPLVSHDHWMVRAQAVQVMSERGVERAVPALMRRLEVEQDDFVREALMGALSRLER